MDAALFLKELTAGEIILLFVIYIYWCISQVARAHFIHQELNIINFHIIKQLGGRQSYSYLWNANWQDRNKVCERVH